MELQLLQQELLNRGFTVASQLLPSIKNGENVISNIHQVFKDCNMTDVDLTDDIGILYEQLSNLPKFETIYHQIVVRDFEIILKEFLQPTDELTTIFMEEDELEEAKIDLSTSYAVCF